MVRFRFKRGLRFKEGERSWTLKRQTATRKLQFEEEESGQVVVLTEADFYQRWQAMSWLIDESSLAFDKDLVYLATPKDLRALSERSQLSVRRKLDYIDELKRHFAGSPNGVNCNVDAITAVSEHVAQRRNEMPVPHWQTIWRWWVDYRSTSCCSKLEDGRQRNRYKTDSVQFSVFEEVVSEVFLTTQRKPGKAVVDAVRDRYWRLNQGLEPGEKLKPPSPATIYRWLGDLHRVVTDQARMAKPYADRATRIATGGVKVESLLERVEIDHTPIDLFVVCSRTRMVLGRPWLTNVIDRRSRMVLGFYISFHAPSAYSVLYALRMAILPKEELLAELGDIKSPWPARGLPLLIAMDNGMDLHANAVEEFALDAGIELLYCGVARPEMKGAIERLFRTLNHDLFHQLPGTAFHNVVARDDYPSEAKAALDIDQMTKIYVKWVVDFYHRRPHDGLDGKSPLEVWQELEGQSTFEMPAYPRQLDLMVGEIATRRVFHYGVEYDSIRYQSAVLGSLIERSRKHKIKVQIRVYEHDISYIDVRMPNTDEFVRVPAVDTDYCQGLNRDTHRLNRRRVIERFGNEWTQQQLREVKAEIQALVDAAIGHHKAVKRKRATAAKMVDSESVLGLRESIALTDAMQRFDLDPEPPLPTLASSTLLPRFDVSVMERGAYDQA